MSSTNKPIYQCKPSFNIYSNISWLKNGYKSCKRNVEQQERKWENKRDGQLVKQVEYGEKHQREWYRSAFEFSISKKKGKKNYIK